MTRFMFLAAAFATLLSTTNILAQTREDKVRNDKTRVEADGFWIYNDLPRAFADARTSGKPIVVVLRCIPCEECVKLDDELIDGDPQLQPLLEQFVRVRVVATNGLDLSIFQFDTDQSFAMFLLNSDGTIYGRFGTRSHRTEWMGDVSIAGMAEALRGALELHQGYPANRDLVVGKRGPVPEFDRPEKLPPHASRYSSQLDYAGKVVDSCIHCHQIGDAQREVFLDRDGKLPEEVLFPFPHPKTVGFVMAPDQRATLKQVTKGSDADLAGFQAGDRIVDLQGQRLLSTADLQWVLHRTPADGDELLAHIMRGEQPLTLTLKLDEGWRRRDDIAWRASTWELRRRTLGGMKLDPLRRQDQVRLQIASPMPALRVEHVGEYAPHDLAKKAGLQADDILIEFDGLTTITRETDLIPRALATKRPGDTVRLAVIRAGKRIEFSYLIP